MLRPALIHHNSVLAIPRSTKRRKAGNAARRYNICEEVAVLLCRTLLL
jgi:hypothetical protein